MPAYTIDAYSAGRADMAMLPEMMQLGQLRQMRQGLEQNDYQLRREAREEQAVFAEADEFDAFSGTMQASEGMDAKERAQLIEDQLVQNPSWGSNARIRDALAAFGAADRNKADVARNRLQTKQDEAAELTLSEDEALRDINFEKRRIEASTELEKVKAQDSAFKALLDAQGLQTVEQFGNFLGSAGDSIDIRTKEKILDLADDLGDDPSKSGLMEGLGKVVAGFGKADSLMKSFTTEMGQHSAVMEFLGKQQVNLDPNQDPELFQASFARAMEIANGQKDPKVKEKLIKAATAANEANALGSQAGLLKAELSKELDTIDRNDPIALRKWARRWGLRAGELNGMVDRETNLRTTQFAREKEALDTQKKVLEVAAMLREPKNEQFKQQLARDAMELKKRLVAKDEQGRRLEIFKIVSDAPSSRRMNTEEKMAEVDEIMNLLGTSDVIGNPNGVSLLDDDE